jgi:predicted nucleic acid-binding protein
MILVDLVDGASVFLDANILVYHFAPHPAFGQACNAFVRRIESQAILGFTSTAVLSEVAHHLMTFEAATAFGWSSKVVQRLRKNPSAVKQLQKFCQSIVEVPQLGIRILTIPDSLVERSARLSMKTGLLSNDALIAAVMEQHGLTHLASNDDDFDRVPGISRYAPA